MYIKINSKDIGPYEGFMSSDNSVKGDILPILYDNAKIELYKSEFKKFSLGYKKSKSLFGNEIKYADIIDEISGEVFSFQVKNIFFARIIGNDLKVLALVGEEIKLYENFGKSEKLIEIDGDKNEITPLGYYDMFISYDEDYYYPLILNEKIKNTHIKKFYDYYGYKAYEDNNGNEHLLMLIEDEKSSDYKIIWYFIDNFNIISELIDFKNDSEYIEEWDINENGDIFMTLTSGAKWYLDKTTKKLLPGNIPTTQKKVEVFIYTRHFEDTDNNFIVGKNINGFFVIDRKKEKINENDQKKIVYFKDFLKHINFKDDIFFLMKNENDEIVLVNDNNFVVLVTDLSINNEIKAIKFLDENLFEIEIDVGEKRQYLI